MAEHMSIALANGALEVLMRFVGDLNFEFSGIPIALTAGTIVGACSLFGGLIGGKLGTIIGGTIGYQINNRLLPTIRNVGNMLRELNIDHLRNLFNLLIRTIQNTVSNVLGRTGNQNLNILDLLERYGTNSDVQMNIINTLIIFFNDVHGGAYRQVTL